MIALRGGSPDPKPGDESLMQLVAALAIVLGLVGIALVIILAGDKGKGPEVITTGLTIVATIVGGLVNALTAPSGIAKVLASTRADPKPPAPVPVTTTPPAAQPGASNTEDNS